MLVTLLFSIYISLLCWTWGFLALKIFTEIAQENGANQFSFPITCFLGLSLLALVTGLLSMFMPLGTFAVQLILFIPALFAWLRFKAWKTLREKLRFIKQLNIVFLLALFISCLLVLAMSSWSINHPDTIAYHSQVIKWIENFRIIPGLVHLNPRYGLQNSWFVLCSVFSFKWTGTQALTFINTTVLLWYLMFIIERLNESYKTRAIFTGLGWMLLFAFSMWEYTQVRLTATSASPDFIAGLGCWLVFYLFLSKEESSTNLLVIFFLCLTAVTLKLSAVLILLLAGWLLVRLIEIKKRKIIFPLAIVAAITLAPFVTRNIITTGYIAFPSQVPDMINVDWKYDQQSLIFFKDYIAAYAKMSKEAATAEETIRQAGLSPTEWLPQWWRNLSVANMFMFALLILSLLYSVVFLKRWIRQTTVQTWLAICISIAGLVVWLFTAPDPRFAIGFTIPLIAILFLNALPISRNTTIANQKNWLFIPAIFMVLTLTVYSGYRFIYYFKIPDIIFPEGLKKTNFQTIQCEGATFHVAESDQCGDTPVPCIYESCSGFLLRGTKITTGFRANDRKGN